ncbi:hypothetical protein [Serinibacter salmoneus]|uniref:Uncharacterized protein n=1 Tax=Serinibacter salmoneus TaxID=556530 RepID=A0A2A9CYV7_9MICO|nr:hypothetical protein [Serinibacter salmoneus]PFG18800.1 hypothetical protein ATL40_0344 [Serinibacter salmoneus]
MGWLDDVLGRRGDRDSARTPAPGAPREVPTSAEILQAVAAVQERVDREAPGVVSARVQHIGVTLEHMAPNLDRMGTASLEAHTVVATATSYLPEAVNAYLRLPRGFADRRAVTDGKTALMLLVDQLDLLAATVGKISDAVARQDANALIAHGMFLEEKFGGSSLAIAPDLPTPAQGQEQGHQAGDTGATGSADTAEEGRG